MHTQPCISVVLSTVVLMDVSLSYVLARKSAHPSCTGVAMSRRGWVHFYFNNPHTCCILLPPFLKLTQYLTETASTGGSPSFLIALYQRLFGSNSHQNIVRYNDFANVANYFLQKVSFSGHTHTNTHPPSLYTKYTNRPQQMS